LTVSIQLATEGVGFRKREKQIGALRLPFALDGEKLHRRPRIVEARTGEDADGGAGGDADVDVRGRLGRVDGHLRPDRRLQRPGQPLRVLAAVLHRGRFLAASAPDLSRERNPVGSQIDYQMRVTANLDHAAAIN
jgi:hypothetical protein